MFVDGLEGSAEGMLSDPTDSQVSVVMAREQYVARHPEGQAAQGRGFGHCERHSALFTH